MQRKLNRVANMIAKAAVSASTFLFIVLFIKFLVSLPESPLDGGEKGQRFMQILIVSLALVAVFILAIPVAAAANLTTRSQGALAGTDPSTATHSSRLSRPPKYK